MKTLGKLKLLTVSALLVLGMSSCLKTSDPEFQFGASPAYILQTGTGDNAKFQPVMRIYAYEAFANASVTFTPANDKIQAGPFTFIAGNNAGEKWLSTSYGIGASDSIPNGTYTVTASNQEGKTATLSALASLSKKLGEIESTISYTAANGVKAEWKKVENATNYYLMYRTTDMKGWAYWSFSKIDEDKLSGTFNENIASGTELQIAVGACCTGGSYSMPLFRCGTPIEITWGTDSPVPGE